MLLLKALLCALLEGTHRNISFLARRLHHWDFFATLGSVFKASKAIGYGHLALEWFICAEKKSFLITIDAILGQLFFD